MLLAIEQGNTNTLFAVHDGTDWIAQWRAATESSRSSTISAKRTASRRRRSSAVVGAVTVTQSKAVAIKTKSLFAERAEEAWSSRSRGGV